MRLLQHLTIAVAVFGGSVLACAVVGGLIGKFIAVRFPHYYPSMFPQAATQPFFDATEVGIATGVGQGAAAGLLVGAVMVLALAIANGRRDGRGTASDPDRWR